MLPLILNTSVITLNLIGLRAPVKDKDFQSGLEQTIRFHLSERDTLSKC